MAHYGALTRMSENKFAPFFPSFLFVDTPLSARDLAKVRKTIERKNAAGGLQGLAPQVLVPVGRA